MNGVISTDCRYEDGSSVEVGIVGKDGATDVSIVLGDDISSHRGIVQLAGSALRLSAGRSDGGASPGRRTTLGLASVCALHARAGHPIGCLQPASFAGAALCPVAVEHARRVEADTFPMTHEFLAYMLGVRRAGVTVAAQALQRPGECATLAAG